MIKQRIMYVCSECAEGCPEACGHYDRTELRVMPDGAWLCESCFDNNDDNEFLSWGHLPAPEEYRRIPDSAQGAAQPNKAWQCLAVSKAACAWPDCGCDPEATKVIAALVDQGWEPPKSSDGQLGEAGRAGVVADMGARPMSPAGVAPGPSEATIAAAIKTFLQRKYGAAAVQLSSDGVERIYYNGVSLPDLAKAVSGLGALPEGMRGAADITAERQRQVTAEGWSPDHDDEHADHQIPLAALCYLYASIYDPGSFVFRYWPWDQAWWKPADARRNLVKAGALIAAEIDRLDRASQHPSTDRGSTA